MVNPLGSSPPTLMVLALVPARGGSKGIPRKNIRLLGVYPLIAYSIAAGQQAKWVERVIVSTDDEEIAAVARVCGAETPFLRPPEHAQDHTTDLPVFQHALAWLEKHEGYRPDIVVQLRPTSPFRPAGCVDESIQVLLDHPEATSVRAVVPSGQNPYKMWRLSGDGPMAPLLDTDFDEPYNMPRQKLPPTYWQTGHIDTVRSEVIRQGSMSGKAIYPLVMDPRYTADLDNLLDWERAESRLADPQMPIVTPAKRWDELDLPSLPVIWPAKPALGTKRPMPPQVEMVVFDFDGVMTDDRVYVSQDGMEMVAAHRGDGMGIAMLKRAGIRVLVLSTETNPVVSARAKKLDIPVIQGVGRKGDVLAQMLAAEGTPPEKVIYLGNDVNDIPCFPVVGCAFVVADAHPAAKAAADQVLTRNGGFGAVRELCDLLLANRPSA